MAGETDNVATLLQEEKKPQQQHLELQKREQSSSPDQKFSSSSEGSNGSMYNFGDADRVKALEKNILWKTDIQVVTMALFIYFLSFLDRSNIGQARQSGLLTDLKMSAGYDYSMALTVLYIPYILFEVPSNLLIKKVTPSIWLPGLLTAWGLVTTLQGIVKTKTGLYIDRAFLGLSEAGVLPGISLWLTMFYRPEEIMFRQAIYFSGASLSGAFSGLLSVAIGKLNGKGDLGGWAWIFIIEGMFTVVVGVILFFILPNGPKNLFLLTEEEKSLASARLDPMFGRKEAGAEDEEPYTEPFRWSEVLRAFIDPRNILFAISGFCVACGLYGFAFFAPTLIKALDPSYTAIQAQLLSCGPYGVSFVVSIIIAVLSDRYKWRLPATVFSFLLCIIGFAMARGLPTHRVMARYGSLIVAASGLYTVPVSVLSWISTINASHYKKATAIAFYIIFTNSGGLASSWMFYDSPKYHIGFTTNLVLNIVGLLCILLLELIIMRDNKRKAEGKADHLVEALREKGYGPRRIRIELGDRHPDYRCML